MRNFIRHPIDIPIKIIKSESESESEDCLNQSLHDISIGGLRCRSDKPLAAGAEIKIIIDLVDPVLEIPGIVIWCRAVDKSTADASYELGIEYQGEKDVYRLRMVEQICHIEHYRKEVQIREGRNISSEQAASEWITKFAGKFPK
jgi:Tfp pilus assembly protein PilZ